MSKASFYRDGDGYLALTGDCPPGFKDLLFVSWAGSPLTEGVLSKEQVAKMQRVEAADLPDDWRDAFEAQGVKVGKKSAPKTRKKPRPVEVEVELLPSPNSCLTTYAGGCMALGAMFYVIIQIVSLFS